MDMKGQIMRELIGYKVGRGEERESMTERVRIYGMCVAGHGWRGRRRMTSGEIQYPAGRA